MDPEPAAPAADDAPSSGPDGSHRCGEASPKPAPEFENAAFTFEGQIERLQAMVVGINRRGGRTKKIAQVLVLGGLALLALFYLAVILIGILG